VTLSPASAIRTAHDHSGDVTYHGRVSNVPDNNGVHMLLEMRAPSYGNAMIVPFEFTTDTDGGFALKILPPAVTVTVRAVIAPGQQVTGASPTRRLTLVPNLVFTIDRRSATKASFEFTALADETLSLRGGTSKHVGSGGARRVLLYSIASGAHYGYRVASARLGRTRCRYGVCSRIARGTFTISGRVRHARSLLACSRAPAFRGIGGALPARLCGNRRVRVR
jgi:hypothetical protein